MKIIDLKDMPNSDHITGLPEELFVAQEVMQEGCNVSLPFGGKAKYDLLIERGGKILKIQVKTARPDDNPFRQEIIELNKYTESQVDFFAGVVDVNDILAKAEAKELEGEPSVNVPRHVFYKEFDEVGGQTARLNYRKMEGMPDYHQNTANSPEDFDFNAKIEPRLPDKET